MRGLALLALLACSCASLSAFAKDAERYRKEVADTLTAVQAVLRECEAMAEPRPALCVEAAKLDALLHPYVPEVHE